MTSDLEDVSGEPSRSPDTIWQMVATIEHMTYRAAAQRNSQADAEDDDLESTADQIELTPLLLDVRSSALTFGLRASCRFDEFVVTFEEAARVELEEPVKLSTPEVQDFGSEYMLPLLVPYVEVGFAQMCSMVDQRPPQFPLLAVNGNLYSNTPQPDSDRPSPTLD